MDVIDLLQNKSLTIDSFFLEPFCWSRSLCNAKSELCHGLPWWWS